MTEYRVVWQRVGLRTKRKRYVSRAKAQRFAGLLTMSIADGIRMRGHEPDQLVCCDGYDCGCGGLTYEQDAKARYTDMPALEWVRIDAREVGKWATDERP